MLPKIQFHRSFVYDEHLLRRKGFRMPTDAFIYKNTRKLEMRWRKFEKQVLRELSRITGLPWREAHIYAYITAGVGWFSMPLTMSITNDIDSLFHTLIHELTHRILSENENWPLIKKKWFKMMRKYRDEAFVTRIHVPVHAIHKHIYLKFFEQKDMDREVERMQKYSEYRRAWKIVERDGYKEIIRAISLAEKGI